MNSREGSREHLLATAVRFALIFALFAAVWAVYRRLPEGEGASLGGATRAQETALRIVLRGPALRGKLPVQLYPINVLAARREYDSEHRPGLRFEDFIERRMGDRQPLTTEFDERGEALLAVPPGKWWVHVTLPGAEELTWRLPVNVSGREKTIELTPDNAYTRAKSF